MELRRESRKKVCGGSGVWQQERGGLGRQLAGQEILLREAKSEDPADLKLRSRGKKKKKKKIYRDAFVTTSQLLLLAGGIRGNELGF